MVWNNRIMCHKEDESVWYGLHEVFYNDKAQICGWTTNALEGADSVDELIAILRMQARGAYKSRDAILDYDMEPEGDWDFADEG